MSSFPRSAWRTHAPPLCGACLALGDLTPSVRTWVPTQSVGTRPHQAVMIGLPAPPIYVGPGSPAARPYDRRHLGAVGRGAEPLRPAAGARRNRWRGGERLAPAVAHFSPGSRPRPAAAVRHRP